MVKEKLGINQPGAPLFLTDDALWLVSPRVPREFKGYLLQNGVGGIPGDDTRLYDEMQAHGLIEANTQGQSVWSVTIQQDGWSVDLSCLRVPPALIWPTTEERPEPWSGSLTGREKAQKEGKKDRAEPDTAQSTADARPTPPATAPLQSVAAAPAADAADQDKSSPTMEQAGGLDTDSLIDLVTGGDTDNRWRSQVPIATLLKGPELFTKRVVHHTGPDT